MGFTLIVRDHGRFGYLSRCLTSIGNLMGLDFFDRKILSEDGVDWQSLREKWDFREWLIQTGWELHSTGPDRQGLTANLRQAWGQLGPDDDWVFDVESDFVIHEAPLDAMRETLEANPHVANMVLVRQPWNQAEQQAGSVLAAQPYDIIRSNPPGWLEHIGGFWLNPFVARASLLRTLQPGVESSLTEQCRSRLMTFGYWGEKWDPPRVTHIGAEGGMGSPGWKP